jgi:molybdopterin-containing oxidoreductase family iron-sulfur binding subunit
MTRTGDITRSAAARFDLARARAVASRGGMRFWTGIEELIDQDGFRAWLAAEFPSAAPLLDDSSRRQVLKLMGASLLLAGLTGCQDEAANHALPYVNQPDYAVPGVPRHYATALTFEGYVQPVIAKTIAGRPIKLDGHPDHPATRGGSDAFMQAALFGLYDPEWSKSPTRDGIPVPWSAMEQALATLRESWRNSRGEGLRILTAPTTSPTMIRQMQALTGLYPRMRWHRHAPAMPAQRQAALTQAFGRPATPHLRLDRCAAIVSIDDDLLGPGPHQVMQARGWSARRGEPAPGQGRSRLHVAEAVPSLTGVAASSRLPCDPPRLGALIQALGATFSFAGWTTPDLSEAENRWLDRAVSDLRRYPGQSLLTVGPHLDPSWQAAAFAINEALSNAGETVWYSEPLPALPSEAETLEALASDVAAGRVDTLIVIDCNPSYTSPDVFDDAAMLSRIPHLWHIGSHADETAMRAQWHLPLSHSLESWSDGRAVDGTVSIIQPVISPLYATRSLHQLLDMLAGQQDPANDAAVRATWRERFGDGLDRRWADALHRGWVEGETLQPLALTAKSPPAPPSPDETSDPALHIVFRPDPTIWDGRFANIAWLQELPKPISKLTWDNVIAVSPALAGARALSNGDMVEITVGERHVRGPVWIVPGQAANTVALTFGYGRRGGGEIATAGGYDAYSIRAGDDVWHTQGTIARIAGQYQLATTQQHHRMDGFDFVREVTAARPTTPKPKDTPTLYPEWPSPDHAWAMAIDLDRCIGCNACIAACNVENNVPVVGKDQVARGREMLWLRVDRYYTGDVDHPRSFFQPVPCMHCEKAPCEMGCPVHATVHSPDGINQMVYNRCIGTRTCSSYCPYKVRRFNWYDYRDTTEAGKAAKNPDVSVRSRGVMEKCTYCTQRIQSARVEADKNDRPLRRDEVVTACQQACPTQAITFGDLNDSDSAVSKLRRSGRHYALLEELGTRPRTTYLARWNDSEGDES